VAWQRNRYYIRNTRIDGRVVSEYYGRGERADRAVAADAERRAERQARAADWKAKQSHLDVLDASLAELDEPADLLLRAALLAAGFHRHDRGEWRRRRESKREEV
jgi:hypothetical protein